MAATSHIIESEWIPDALPLPTEHDFDPCGNGRDLDAQCAWRAFGGLTRSEAYEQFSKNPMRHQEDFMFMGGVAFAYYYPVIERFLFEAVEGTEPPDREAWILAHGIRLQFSRKSFPHVKHLAGRVLRLAAYVRNNLHLYDTYESGRQRIDEAWQELERQIVEVCP